MKVALTKTKDFVPVTLTIETLAELRSLYEVLTDTTGDDGVSFVIYKELEEILESYEG